MKFVKVVIDGKEYYKMLEEKDTAGVGESESGEGEIIDADIENNEAGAKQNGTAEFFAKMKSGAEELGAKIADGARDIGAKIASGAKDLGEKVKSGTKNLGERLFGKDKTFDPESKEAKLLRLLPYMSKKEAHKVCEQFIEDDEVVRKLSLPVIMPFLDTSDCDALFIKCLDSDIEMDLPAVTAFVSKDCLSAVVDDYIAGKYPELDIDELYPCLSDADIKRLFYHIINSEEKNV